MMLIRTTLAPSKIEGIGVFAAEPVKAGTLIWKFHPLFDLVLSEDDLPSLSPIAREYIARYAYKDSHGGKYILCGDHAKFFNHSANPNTAVVDDPSSPWRGDIAARDIVEGEELTTDYAEFDAEFGMKISVV